MQSSMSLCLLYPSLIKCSNALIIHVKHKHNNPQ